MSLKSALKNIKSAGNSDNILVRRVAERALEEMRRDMESFLEDAKRHLDKIVSEAKRDTNSEITTEGRNHIRSIPHLKGDDGKTPTKEELVSIIGPLIPKIKDGKTPKRNELLNLIRPLISEAVDENYIVEKILSQIKLPDTPTASAIADVVLKKVNKRKVEMEDVEGLLNKLHVLRRNIAELRGRKQSASGGQGGGGMGNPQHEEFSINSGTTTITTAFPIAAQGTAIFPFDYQGQVLRLNNHYTVGPNRKTITFDAAVQAQLVNGTTVGITYIRG